MQVFISWSGERSHQVALLFRWWLKCVIQACDPWVSSEDIESGAIWFNEIGDQLSSTTIGIICLTQENKDKPWILFESGALMKGLSKSRVCPFLVDLENQDVNNPLAQFNLSYHDKEGVFKIVKAVNNSLADKALNITILEQVFATYWPQFESEYSRIITNTVNTPTQKREESDILKELLLTVRGFDRRISHIENNGTFISRPSQSPNYNLNVTARYSIRLRPDLGHYDASTLVSELGPLIRVDQFGNLRSHSIGDNQLVEFSLSEPITASVILLSLKQLGYNVLDVSIG